MSKYSKFQVDIFNNDREMLLSRSKMATFHDNDIIPMNFGLFRILRFEYYKRCYKVIFRPLDENLT